jgi:hypothetical protein
MGVMAGVGGSSIALAFVAAMGGFGCICNVAASHRCGGEDVDFPSVLDPDPSESDAGTDADASDSGK